MAGESPDRGTASAAGRWEELRPADAEPGYLVGVSDARAGYVNGLRDLADFLELRPEIPVPDTGETISLFSAGTAREQRAQVDYAGDLLGGLVTDETARGGDLYAVRRFGPVTYEMVATGAGAEFSTGEDVRLIPQQARVAERQALATAGTVTGIERQEDGTFTYTVHFPGQAGIQRGLTADVLEEAGSPAVRLWDDKGALSIKEAEERLIGFDENTHPGASDQPDALDLLTNLADACRMGAFDLARQLQPKIAQREQELRAGKQSGPAALAANDIPQPLMSTTGLSIEFAGSDHQPAPSAQQPRRGGPSR